MLTDYIVVRSRIAMYLENPSGAVIENLHQAIVHFCATEHGITFLITCGSSLPFPARKVFPWPTADNRQKISETATDTE